MGRLGRLFGQDGGALVRQPDNLTASRDQKLVGRLREGRALAANDSGASDVIDDTAAPDPVDVPARRDRDDVAPPFFPDKPALVWEE
jgi:hypothetical protein